MTSSSVPGVQAPTDLVELGRIAGAYGIQGWVRVHPYSAQGGTLLNVRQWWLKAPDFLAEAGASSRLRPVHVARSRAHGSAIVARLDGVEDRDQAEALKALTIWVSRAQFAPLEDDEYYWTDLIGCRVYGDDAGRQVLIGEVLGVMDNGAHGVLRVARALSDNGDALQFELDARGRPREELVPFVAAHVHTVDLENRLILTGWPADFRS